MKMRSAHRWVLAVALTLVVGGVAVAQDGALVPLTATYDGATFQAPAPWPAGVIGDHFRECHPEEERMRDSIYLIGHMRMRIERCEHANAALRAFAEAASR